MDAGADVGRKPCHFVVPSVRHLVPPVDLAAVAPCW